MTDQQQAVLALLEEAQHLAGAAARIGEEWTELPIEERLLALATVDASIGRLLSSRAALAHLLGEQWVRR